MSFDTLGDINWLAVIVSAVVYYSIGAAWYSPALLGKPWMRSIGWDPDSGPPEMTVKDYTVPLIAYFVAAIGVAMLAAATGSNSFGEGVALGLVLGIGVAAVIAYVTSAFDPTRKAPMTWFGVTAGYHVLGLLITAVVVSIWN